MATTGSERQLAWVFQRTTESSTLQMNLVNMSMASSVVFRKMKLLEEEENNGKPAKQQKTMDKKEIAATVKDDLQSIGLASSSCAQQGDGGKDDERNGQMPVGEEDDSSSLGCDTDPQSLSKKQNLSGQKGNLKSKLWTGFHPEEQKTYSSFVSATDGTESRQKTALDEVWGALLFMRSFLEQDGSKQGSLAGGAEQARAKKRVRKDASSSGGPTCTGDKAEDVFLATLQFCIGLWMEFCFTGEVVTNGKLFKTWSSLRTELQQIVMTAHESFLCPSSSDPGHVNQVDPLNLAKLLCKTFASKPVNMIIFDDAEEANIKRVTTVMQLHRQDIAEPLKVFIHEKLHLPLMLLDYPMQSLRALTTSIQKGNMRTTVDLMAFLHSMLQTTLPFAWFCFAQDVSDLLTSKGHFIEKTEQAGGHIWDVDAALVIQWQW